MLSEPRSDLLGNQIDDVWIPAQNVEQSTAITSTASISIRSAAQLHTTMSTLPIY